MSLSGVAALVVAGSVFAQMGHMKMMDMRTRAVKHAVVVIHKAEKMAAKKGNYSCCLKHPCDYCMTHMGACHCGMTIMKGMVCSECKGGWDAGDGAIPGINPKHVKAMPRGMSGMKM